MNNQESGVNPDTVLNPSTTLKPTAESQLHIYNELDSIVTEIKSHIDKIEQSFLTIGNLLIEAKKGVPHGKWLEWLDDNVSMSAVTAQRLIRLAREFSNASPVTYLGYAKAHALLAVPQDDREEFINKSHEVNGELKEVADMSKREIGTAIRNWNQKEETAPSDMYRKLLMQPVRNDKKDDPSYVFRDKLLATHSCINDILEYLSKFSHTPGLCNDLSTELLKFLDITQKSVKKMKSEGWKQKS